MSYIVLPSLEVEEGNLEAFLTAARADAAASLENEPRHLEAPHLAAIQDSLHLCHEAPAEFLDRVRP